MNKDLPKPLSIALDTLTEGDVEEGKELLQKFSLKHKVYDSCKINSLLYLLNKQKENTPHTPLESGIKDNIRNSILEVCKLWEIEKDQPYLALKAYCLTGNESGVLRIIDNIFPQQLADNKALSGEPPLVDSVAQENETITKALIERGAWKGVSALRLSLSKAAKLGHVKCLSTIIKGTPKGNIDNTMLRDCLIQSMVNNHLNCYKKICEIAETAPLKQWRIQVNAMHEQSVKDPYYPPYKTELEIINSEIAKRRLIKKLEEEKSNLLTLTL